MKKTILVIGATLVVLMMLMTPTICAVESQIEITKINEKFNLNIIKEKKIGLGERLAYLILGLFGLFQGIATIIWSILLLDPLVLVCGITMLTAGFTALSMAFGFDDPPNSDDNELLDMI